jgi:DNA-binding GntR family transcriptional regulator
MVNSQPLSDRSVMQMSGPATAQQQAYIYLQDRIVSGDLPGGSRLRLESIAETLGISRMPVREAIRQLDAEGYVTIRPNRGAVVTTRTAEEVVEIFEIRASLEGLAVRTAVGTVGPHEIADLEHELERLRRVEGDSPIWIERHDEFHDHLCRLSRRQQLCAEIRRFRLAVRPYLRLYLKRNERPEIKGFEHIHIVAAIAAGDPNVAEMVMRSHVMANAQAIANSLPVATAMVDGDEAGGARRPMRRRRVA